MKEKKKLLLMIHYFGIYVQDRASYRTFVLNEQETAVRYFNLERIIRMESKEYGENTYFLWTIEGPKVRRPDEEIKTSLTDSPDPKISPRKFYNLIIFEG